DEQHAAMIADAMAPAGKAHLLADVACAQGAAGVGAIAVHALPILYAARKGTCAGALVKNGKARAGAAREARGLVGAPGAPGPAAAMFALFSGENPRYRADLLHRRACAHRCNTALPIGASNRALERTREARLGARGDPRGVERACHHHRERNETCANEQISEHGTCSACRPFDRWSKACRERFTSIAPRAAANRSELSTAHR